MDAPRTYLFVPGDRPERFDKALSAKADAVILDLEDAVASEAKPRARHLVAQWLAAVDAPPCPLFVRVNGWETPWIVDDLQMCRSARVGVVVPKVEQPAQMARAARALAPDVPILALIESAKGLASAAAVASSGLVRRLLFGSLDFMADLQLDHAALAPYRAQLVLASRLAGLPAPVDGPCTSLHDQDEVHEHAATARASGFGGVLCIHPRQVHDVHAAFAPTESEAAWAQEVLRRAASSAGGVVQLDGHMIDAPVVARARRIVAWGAVANGPAR